MILERWVTLIFLTGGFLIGVSIFWYLRLWERGEEGRWDGARPGPEGGPGPAPARRLPRLFLIGFTLCVLTGPLVLWMLIRGGASVEGPRGAVGPAGEALPGAGAGAIGAVLQERLPDAETQARRHAELIAVIRDLGRTGQIAPGSLTSEALFEELARQPVRLRPHWRPSAQAALAAVGALLLLAAGVIVWMHEVRRRGALLGVGICAISLAFLLQACPNLLAFSFERTAVADGPAQAGVPVGGAGPGADSSGPSSPGNLASRLVHVASVGPFPEAQHVAADTLVVAALDALERLISPAEAGFILVVGHVDPRPLGAAARGIYGTDTGLAQARANWVRARLLDLAGANLPADRVLALPAGPASTGVPAAPAQPTGTGAAAAPARSPGDRCVDIYAFGVPR